MRSWGMLIDCRTLLLVILAASVVNAPTWMNITGVAVGSLSAAETSHDVVIYGGTSCGVAAAVRARRMGKSVVLIEPTRRLGGLTTGGLGQTDIGNKAAIGGIAREFYQAVRKYYDDPNVWKWQTRAQYADSGQTRTASGEDTMWTFEPSAALKIFHDWVRENRLEVVYGERLDRKSGVAMTRSIPWRISAIRMESGRTFSGQMFIDATYEGDLMAAANVSYTVGREPLLRIEMDRQRPHVVFLSWDTEDGSRAATNLLRSGAPMRLRLRPEGQGKSSDDPTLGSVDSTSNATTYRLTPAPAMELLWSLNPTSAALSMTLSRQGASGKRSAGVELLIPFDPRVTPTTVLPSQWEEDGTDTLGHYQNGGITAGQVLHFLAAHYVVGQSEQADRVLRAMLERQAQGKFQNGVRDIGGQGIDWTDWKGNATGYEGYLDDSYRFLQAVLLREPAFRARYYRPLM